MITATENDQKKNLQNIQRIDEFADEILMQCTQAALYEFDLLDNNWTNTQTMGPLFVYKRNKPPLYSMLIANRQSLNDYVEHIVENLNFKHDPPYILIHRQDGTIRGVWIYGEDECKKIFNYISQLQKLELAKEDKKTAKALVATPTVITREQQSKSNMNILMESTQKSNDKLITSKIIVNKTASTGPNDSPNNKTIAKALVASPTVITREQQSKNNMNILKKSTQKSNDKLITSKTIVNKTASTSSSDIRKTLVILLRRIDAFACEIILYSQKAVLYEHYMAEKKWTLSNIRGPLFIFKRLDAPFYSLMITDEDELKQFVQPLVCTLRIKLRASYIFLQITDDKIYGIWTPSRDESKRIHIRLSVLMRSVTGREEGEVSCWEAH